MTGLIAAAFIPVFAVIAAGYAVRASGFMPEPFWRGVNALNYRVLLPAILLVTLIGADLTAPGAPRMALLAGGVTALTALFAWGVSLIATRDRGIRAGMVAVAAVWNVILFLALAERLFGPEVSGLAAAAFASGLVAATLIGVGVFATAQGGGAATVARKIALDPVLIACTVGIALSLFAPTPPEIVMAPFAIIGAGALGVILLSIGAGLNFAALKGRLAIMGLAAALRCVAPLALCLGLGIALGLPPTERALLVLAGCGPSAAFVYAMADAFDGRRELVAGMITASVVLSALVLPVAVAIALAP